MELARQFLGDVVSVFQVGENKTKFAFEQFSKGVYGITDFDDDMATNKFDFENHIRNVRRRTRNGETHTNKALKRAKTVFEETSRSGGIARPVVLMITDGIPFRQSGCRTKQSKGEEQIQCARDDYKALIDEFPDLYFIFLAIGLGTDNSELKGLFTFDNYEPDLVVDTTFDNLNNFTNILINGICA